MIHWGVVTAILLLLAAWLAHEFGHWLALRSLGLAGGLRNRWLLGVALEIPPECQGWRESYVALAGPAVNLLLAGLAAALDCQQFFAANFVLAAVNLLPMLPLDGGKALRGILGARYWLGCSRFLLLLGKSAALAMAGAVYYFGLRRFLLLLAVWLYLVAWREERNLPYLYMLRLLENERIEEKNREKKYRKKFSLKINKNGE